MLKTRRIELTGRDSGGIVLTELPALVADRHARVALKLLGEDPCGGVVALAFRHIPALVRQGKEAIELLEPFVGDALSKVREWKNISRIQQAALALHVDFLVGRELLEIPVGMQADRILKSLPEVSATFCTPHIAAVLSSKLASYHELETSLSTEDVFNLVEILNVDGIRDWHARQLAKDMT